MARLLPENLRQWIDRLPLLASPAWSNVLVVDVGR
jgi:hypothetical protein